MGRILRLGLHVQNRDLLKLKQIHETMCRIYRKLCRLVDDSTKKGTNQI